MNPKPSLRAVRGEILHFLSDPAVAGAAEDRAVAVSVDGRDFLADRLR